MYTTLLRCSVCVAVIASGVLCAASAQAPDKAKPFTMSALEKAIVDLTNKEREKKGLPAVKPNPQLFEAARAHSANMARQNKLAHVLDGKNHIERMKAANCARARQQSVEQVVAGWMNSEGHRDAILHKNATEIGVGIAVSASGETYYTQDFGKAKQ